jgi:glutamate--cysteine ligase
MLYDDDALAAVWDLVKPWSWEERVSLYHQVHRAALAAKVRGIAVRELCKELLDIAEYGLRRQRAVNARGEDESIYLERVRDAVRKGISPADRLREKWLGEWNREVGRLIAATKYTTVDRG